MKNDNSPVPDGFRFFRAVHWNICYKNNQCRQLYKQQQFSNSLRQNNISTKSMKNLNNIKRTGNLSIYQIKNIK